MYDVRSSIEQLLTQMEKRKSSRYDVVLRVRYRKPRSGQYHYHETTSLNISATGICLFTEEPLETDRVIHILLYINGYKPPIGISCRVVWCREEVQGLFRIGAEYLEMDSGTHFVRLLLKALSYSLKLSTV